MNTKIVSYLKELLKDESGQGINEYAAMLTFVCLLIILVFSFSQGTLSGALSQSFSAMTGQLVWLCNEAAGP
jgi:Flp pilus assembly pilin Flp